MSRRADVTGVIHNWSTFKLGDEFTAPEVSGFAVQGRVYKREGKQDGRHIITSRVVSSLGRVVTTKSGSKYRLGRIDPKFRRYLKACGYVYSRTNPVPFKREVTP